MTPEEKRAFARGRLEERCRRYYEEGRASGIADVIGRLICIAILLALVIAAILFLSGG